MNFRRMLQKYGGAAMTPIAVLPAAAIIIALGTVLPAALGGRALSAAGTALFNYLGLIIAIGCSVGLADGEGVAGLSAGIMWLIIDAIVKATNPELSLGVLSGIIAAVAGAWFYNRFHRIRFPDYFAFFAGQRFVPIISAFAAVLIGIVLGLIGPALQAGLTTVGSWMAAAGTAGVFVYGALERLLIPTGLHHFLNAIVLMLVGNFGGATGDLGRFFAGDPTAGYFMAGAFIYKLFGLPAACLAMYQEARPGARRAIKGLMVTAAVTCFLTGITEPVEFAFLFTAPILFIVHALLSGTSFALTHLLGIRHGFASSAGIVEYIANWRLAERPWLIIPLGAAFAVIYYTSFRFLIRRLNLATPGRLAEEAELDAASSTVPDVVAAAESTSLASAGAAVNPAALDLPERAAEVISALGGKDNLTSVDSCLTRLRLGIVDEERVDESALRRLGALGIVKMGKGAWQVVFGTISDALRHEMRRIIRQG